MIWFYERAGHHLYYEIRLREDGPGYELVVMRVDGSVVTEQFDNEDDLNRRFAELDEALAREGWDSIDGDRSAGGSSTGASRADRH
jgi:hypothetical protein